MENLGDILKRSLIQRNISGDTDTSSKSDDVEDNSEQCPTCGGKGWLSPDVPFDHPDFGKSIPCDCTAQQLESERMERLKRYSNLGPLARLTFDNLLPEGRTNDPQNRERFARCCSDAKAFAVEPRGWVVFTGPSGCGKTHLAAAIAERRVREGYQVFFVFVPDLLDHLRTAFNPTNDVTYDELFERVRNAPLLILDDLGSQSSTSWAEEKLFQILNHRFNAELPTVITINNLEKLDQRIAIRLMNPGIAQVFEVEKPEEPLFQQVGGLSIQFLAEKTFENFDMRGIKADEKGKESLKAALIEARRFAAEPDNWLVFLGVHGCGKTHLAAAISNHRLQAGQPVFFAVVPDLLDHLRSTFSPESKITYDELFERIKTTQLLVLDDLGTESGTPWAHEKLYQILNFRYNARLATVITIPGFLEGIEGRLSSRLMDPRISNVIPIFAPDYRSQLISQNNTNTGQRQRRRY
jgi:DNA replication protein DnaC